MGGMRPFGGASSPLGDVGLSSWERRAGAWLSSLCHPPGGSGRVLVVHSLGPGGRNFYTRSLVTGSPTQLCSLALLGVGRRIIINFLLTQFPSLKRANDSHFPWKGPGARGGTVSP